MIGGDDSGSFYMFERWTAGDFFSEEEKQTAARQDFYTVIKQGMLSFRLL